MIDPNTSLLAELQKLWKNKFLVGGVSLAFGIIAFVFTLPFFLKPEFKSTASLVPPGYRDVKNVNFMKSRYLGFGVAVEEDLERIAAHLNSDSCKMVVAKKFDLLKHYELDDIKNVADQMKAFNGVYEGKVSVKITAFSTVEITVFDTDKKLAADISNFYLILAENFTESIARRREGLKSVEQSLEATSKWIKILQDSLAYFRKNHRIYILPELPDPIANIIANNYFGKNEFQENYDKVYAMNVRLNGLENYYADLLNEQIFRRENLQTYPELNLVIARGMPTEYKARPKRSIYILLSLIAGFLSASIFVIFIKK